MGLTTSLQAIVLLSESPYERFDSLRYSTLTFKSKFYIVVKKSMSRIETLKSQFPQLDISLLDILSDLDNTKSHKYLQMLCKIFAKSYTFDIANVAEYDAYKYEIHKSLGKYGYDIIKNESVNYVKHRLLENFFNKSDIEIFSKFREYNERGLIENNDITRYSDLTQIRGSVALCEMKMLEKELEFQSHKEFEDDTWVLVRPLSFQASSRYGSSTRWCTTYENDRGYFFKYFYNGSLVYFINKKTGYKVAMHGVVSKTKLYDISFWNAEDSRCDYFDLDLDDYLFSTIKRIIADNKSNSSFLDKEQLMKVAIDCDSLHRITENEYKICEEIEVGVPINEVRNEVRRAIRNIDITILPTPTTDEEPAISIG